MANWPAANSTSITVESGSCNSYQPGPVISTSARPMPASAARTRLTTQRGLPACRHPVLPDQVGQFVAGDPAVRRKGEVCQNKAVVPGQPGIVHPVPVRPDPQATHQSNVDHHGFNVASGATPAIPLSHARQGLPPV